jgi:hypothetical protein
VDRRFADPGLAVSQNSQTIVFLAAQNSFSQPPTISLPLASN